MSTFAPPLPEGYIAQPTPKRRSNGQSYEFRRVYDADRRLARELSYWIATPIEAMESPKPVLSPRWITYGDLSKKTRVSYAEFSSTATPLETIERWLGG